MKTLSVLLLTAVAAAGVPLQAQAQQERVWRCGNEYTNNATVAQQRGCKIMEGGNLTIVQGTRSFASARAVSMMIGTIDVSRIQPASEKPFSPGIITSSTKPSKIIVAIRARASAPSRAVETR